MISPEELHAALERLRCAGCGRVPDATRGLVGGPSGAVPGYAVGCGCYQVTGPTLRAALRRYAGAAPPAEARCHAVDRWSGERCELPLGHDASAGHATSGGAVRWVAE